MIAFTIKKQARINDASNKMRQGKQSDISNILEIELLFPFICPNIKVKGIKGRVYFRARSSVNDLLKLEMTDSFNLKSVSDL